MPKQPRKTGSGSQETSTSVSFLRVRKGRWTSKEHSSVWQENIASLPSSTNLCQAPSTTNRWRQTAKERIRSSHVVIVLLGPDTHNAPGVKDELSLAGEVRCPVVQLMPQDKELRPSREKRGSLRIQVGHHQSDASRP